MARDERSDDDTRRDFRVHGRVQGVGFRWWTMRQARELGLSGDVSNRSDGSVEIRAAGAPQALDRLRELLRQGPPGARVTSVDERERPGGDLPRPFEISH